MDKFTNYQRKCQILMLKTSIIYSSIGDYSINVLGFLIFFTTQAFSVSSSGTIMSQR